jgi:hypothetical protein
VTVESILNAFGPAAPRSVRARSESIWRQSSCFYQGIILSAAVFQAERRISRSISRAESRVGCGSVCILARVPRNCDLVGEEQHNGQSQGFDLPLHLLQFLPLPPQTCE